MLITISSDPNLTLWLSDRTQNKTQKRKTNKQTNMKKKTLASYAFPLFLDFLFSF